MREWLWRPTPSVVLRGDLVLAVERGHVDADGRTRVNVLMVDATTVCVTPGPVSVAEADAFIEAWVAAWWRVSAGDAEGADVPAGPVPDGCTGERVRLPGGALGRTIVHDRSDCPVHLDALVVPAEPPPTEGVRQVVRWALDDGPDLDEPEPPDEPEAAPDPRPPNVYLLGLECGHMWESRSLGSDAEAKEAAALYLATGDSAHCWLCGGSATFTPKRITGPLARIVDRLGTL